MFSKFSQDYRSMRLAVSYTLSSLFSVSFRMDTTVTSAYKRSRVMDYVREQSKLIDESIDKPIRKPIKSKPIKKSAKSKHIRNTKRLSIKPLLYGPLSKTSLGLFNKGVYSKPLLINTATPSLNSLKSTTQLDTLLPDTTVKSSTMLSSSSILFSDLDSNFISPSDISITSAPQQSKAEWPTINSESISCTSDSPINTSITSDLIKPRSFPVTPCFQFTPHRLH
ncbi:hypothetical protein QVD99_002330 [Batrachochytrium dendrobatidis]|nr:hypothetical protein QVD99_002330 [Batrachochytrium dendrobatidis]